MKQYFVYILKCSDNSYYTGITSDLKGRFLKHQSGYYPESYTHNRRPVGLAFYTEFNIVEQAIAFEKQVKGWSRKKKEAIINDKWEKLKSFLFVKMKVIQKILKQIKQELASTPLSLTIL